MNELEQLLNLIQNLEHPWIAVGLALLVPISVVICIREVSCWFWKINKIVARLESIEYYLQNLQQPLSTAQVSIPPEDNRKTNLPAEPTDKTIVSQAELDK